MSKFSSRLKELRKDKGLTQEELAAIADVSFASISRYESGERDQPKMRILKAFSDEFGVSVDYIMGISDIKDKDFTAAEIARIFRELDLEDKQILMSLGKSLLRKENKQ